MRSFLLACVFALACAPNTRAIPSINLFQEEFAADSPAAPPALRLPKNAKPLRYSATLQLIPNQESFSGEIDIDLEFTEATSLLWLNASLLKVKSAQLKTGDKIRTSPVIVYETPSASGSILSAKIISGGDDFVGFDFGKEIPPGKATLHVSYEGVIAKQDETGIFQQEEEKRWYVFTQFEATDARRAFPCFDEPEYKTPWSLTLRVPGSMKAFANTPSIKEKELINEKNPLQPLREVSFQETKPLPSYLIAFAVGDFDLVDVGKVGKSKIPARIITPKGRAAWGEYAAKHTDEILSALENYTGIPYPFEKLDQIAIPRFSGAMENAGLITYGHTILLAEPGKDTINRQRDYMLTAAHEMGHQWFGDLVTMRWWDDLWLNESFAEWVMGRVMVDLRPEWQMSEEITDESIGAKSSDSVLSAPKIRHKIESKADINDAFDGGITYAKGQAVLTMFEMNTTGEKAFQEKISAYLKKNSFKSATFDDFLAAMTDSPAEAKEMSSFIDQPGVPLVSASLTCDKKGPPRLSLTQSRYFSLGSGEAGFTPWTIRVCVGYKAPDGKSATECFPLSAEKLERTLNVQGCPAWVNLNRGARGYYYSGYSKDMLQRLFAAGLSEMTTSEKMVLLADVNAQVGSGALPIGDALSLVFPLTKESNRYLVSGLASLVGSLKQNHLVTTELRPNFTRFVQSIFAERAKGLGFTPKAGASDEEILLQRTLVNMMAFSGEDKTLAEEAKKLSYAWIKDKGAVSPEFVGTVLSLAANYGDKDLFEVLVKEAKSSDDRRVRDSILSSLGLFKDAALLERAFSLILGGEFEVRDAMKIAWSASSSEANARAAYQFVTKNFDTILKKLPADGAFRYGAYLPYFGGSFCDATSRAEVESFFSSKMKSYEGGASSLAEVLESIDICIAFSAKQRDSLSAFLKKY